MTCFHTAVNISSICKLICVLFAIGYALMFDEVGCVQLCIIVIPYRTLMALFTSATVFRASFILH